MFFRIYESWLHRRIDLDILRWSHFVSLKGSILTYTIHPFLPYNIQEVIMVNLDVEGYLRDLKSWSKSMREVISDKGIPKELLDRWDRWEREITELEDQEVSEETISEIQQSGSELLQQLIRQLDTSMPTYGNHTLPELPYPYDALEPYIDEEIMRLHHRVHHQSYVDGLNRAEKEIYEKTNDPNLLKHWLREQAFHGSGHMLHSIFWKNMTPYSTKVPMKQIAVQIKRDFGSFEQFKELFKKVASSVEGPGWAALLYDPVNHRLVIESIEKHQVNHLVSMIPLLVLDVWEHAYYLQYQTDKAAYVDAWWNIVNWDDVNERFVHAASTQYRFP